MKNKKRGLKSGTVKEDGEKKELLGISGGVWS